MNLSKELTKQVNAHITEVRNYLGNLPADERQEILQAIESHIYDALQSRSNGEPTAALLDAVIAEMDPPESYGTAPSIETEPVQPTAKSGLLKSIGKGYTLKFILITIIAIVYLVLNYMKETKPESADSPPDLMAEVGSATVDFLVN